MENEKVIQITNTNDGIFGLSSSGQLIAFDKEAGHWVLRCSSEILTVNRANVLKRTDVVYQEPQGRHRAPIEDKQELEKGIKMITYPMVAVGLVALAILIYVFVK